MKKQEKTLKKDIFLFGFLTIFLIIYFILYSNFWSNLLYKYNNDSNITLIEANKYTEDIEAKKTVVDPGIKKVVTKYSTLSLSGRNNTTGYYLQKFGFTNTNQTYNTNLIWENVKASNTTSFVYDFTWNVTGFYTPPNGSGYGLLPYAIPFIITDASNNLNITGNYGDQDIFAFSHLNESFNFGNTFNIYVIGLYNNGYPVSTTDQDITIRYVISNLLSGPIAFGVCFANAYNYASYSGTSPYFYVTDYDLTSYSTFEFMVQNGVYGWASFLDSYITLYTSDQSSNTAYQNGYENGFNNGLTTGQGQGYNVGYAEGVQDGIESANSNAFSFSWMYSLFEAANTILNVEIFPNFKIWYIIGIGLIVSAIVAIFKILR